MATQTFEQEWRSSSRETAYPFTDQSDPTQLRSDFLIDMQVAFAGRVDLSAKLTSIAYDSGTDKYTLQVTLAGSIVAFGSQAISRLDEVDSLNGKKVVVVDGAYLMILQPGPGWHDPSWGGGGSWTKTPTKGNTIQPGQVHRQPQTFLRMFIDGLPIPPEDEWPRGVSQKLMAGYNLQFTDQPFNFVPTVGVNTSPAEVWGLEALPGAGAGYAPGDEGDSYVATFNKSGPDSSGNVNWNGEDCLRVSIPESSPGIPIPSTIQIASDCQPCCPCSEYRKVSRAVGRESAKIKDYCDEIAAALLDAKVVYDDGVTKINARRPPIVLVRNIRAVGSHLLFTVSNVSELPIFAYVAIDFISYDGPINPAPIVPQDNGSSYVLQVNQSTFTSLDATINAHRTSLPPLPFSTQENPAAGFPTATISPLTNSGLLVVVGGLTKEQAFSPIPPGQTVEVTLFSKSVDDDILTILTTPSSYDTDAEREAIIAKTLGAKKPRIMFRSVGVLGASHSYPCTGETIEVQVDEFKDDDVIRKVCDTNLERRFRSVELKIRNQIGGRP